MWKSWQTLRGGGVCIQLSVTGKTRNLAHLERIEGFSRIGRDRRREGSAVVAPQ